MSEIIREMSKLELGTNVTITGIALVFSMLLLLVFVLVIFGSISVALSNAKEKKAAKAKETTFAEMLADNNDVSAPVENTNEINDELIAVISAAVSTLYVGKKVKPVIKSIKNASSRRSSWAKAGIADNTRVF